MRLLCTYVKNPFLTWLLVVCTYIIIFYFMTIKESMNNPAVLIENVQRFMIPFLSYTIFHALFIISQSTKCSIEEKQYVLRELNDDFIHKKNIKLV